jgi:hypothetical protein
MFAATIATMKRSKGLFGREKQEVDPFDINYPHTSLIPNLQGYLEEFPMIGRFKIQASAPTNVSPRSNFIPPHNLTHRYPGKCFNVVTRGGMMSVSVVGALTDVGKSGFWEIWNVI